MKISSETKVGLLTIAALAILIVGFNFLKGKNVFNESKKIYAVFQTVGSLEKSNQVKINGLPIGMVYELNPTDQRVSGVVVTIHLTRDVKISKNSFGVIGSPIA